MTDMMQQGPAVSSNETGTRTPVAGKTRAMAASAWNKARNAARAADDYLHDSPWPLIGAAVLVAAAFGYVLGRR